MHRFFKVKAGGILKPRVRGCNRLGNANNGDNAGSCYLNGNNAPSNANANRGAVPYEVSQTVEDEPFRLEENIER